VIAFLPGLLTGLSLIIAIGAQNAFVIRQGLTKKHVLLVVTICAISDALLIVLGVAGLGALISGLPWLLEIIRWFGVAYLTWFGIRSIRSAFKTQSLDASGVQSASAKSVVLSVLGFTFLKPTCLPRHCYFAWINWQSIWSRQMVVCTWGCGGQHSLV
jgi:L-lysine exporter family protein LysE/ArgO